MTGSPDERPLPRAPAAGDRLRALALGDRGGDSHARVVTAVELRGLARGVDAVDLRNRRSDHFLLRRVRLLQERNALDDRLHRPGPDRRAAARRGRAVLVETALAHRYHPEGAR